MPGPFHPLVEQWKTLAGSTQWSSPDGEDAHMSFLVPLDIEGVTIAEFALRGTAYEDIIDAAVTFQLEVGIGGIRTRNPLIRLDWRPKSPLHKNPDKVIIQGTHIHLFDDNWNEQGQRKVGKNLPWAQKVSGIQSFNELLDYAEIIFKIKGIRDIPVPEWSQKLL